MAVYTATTYIPFTVVLVAITCSSHGGEKMCLTGVKITVYGTHSHAQAGPLWYALRIQI